MSPISRGIDRIFVDGFGTDADTNGRFKKLLRSGGDGLSTAFDMPTLLGREFGRPVGQR